MQQLVYIISSMRSGSTLLKALLAEANDVSNLPEIQFHGKSEEWLNNKIRNIPETIVVLKYPSFFHNSKSYPILPTRKAKVIVLIRDPHDTVLSLFKATSEAYDFPISLLIKLIPYSIKTRIFINYWANTYISIYNKISFTSPDVKVLQYEELIKDPITTTKELYQFIGSTKKDGAKTYHKPKNYNWEWHIDDGGEVIKTLKVQDQRKKYSKDQKLMEIIHSNKKVNMVLKLYSIVLSNSAN